MSKIIVIAKFAFYHPGYEDVLPEPSYIVVESNHPRFPLHANVGAVELIEYGLEIPATPTYAQWLNAGKKVYRGE